MSAEVRRALCPAEKCYWIADQISPTNVVARVHLRGHIAAGLLDRAAAALAAEHPLLRVSIRTDAEGTNPTFVRSSGPIPIRPVNGDYLEWERQVDDHEARTPLDRQRGPLIRALTVPPSLRPAYRTLALRGDRVTASENAGEAALAVDGSLETLWRTGGPQQIADWIAVELAEPARLARVELLVGAQERFAARELQVAVSPDGARWMDVRSRPARAPLDAQRPALGPPSQVLVLAPPVEARFVRLGLRRAGAHRWGIAELRLFALP